MKNLLLSPPGHIPFILRPALFITEKIIGKKMYAPRILAWSVSSAIAAAFLEAGVEFAASRAASKRIATLVRMQVSLTSGCPFCIDMNSFEYQKQGITDDEAASLKQKSLQSCPAFSETEKALLQWVEQISGTPIDVDPKLLEYLIHELGEKEVVVLGALAAKVNFWARLIQAYQVPQANLGGLRELERFN